MREPSTSSQRTGAATVAAKHGRGPPHITISRMKSERGWTDGLVRTHLGDPDKLAPNPHYRRAPEMRLYRLDRVEAAENTDSFRTALAGRERRREAGARAVETKRRQARMFADTVDLRYDFPDTAEEARKLGHESWVRWMRWRDQWRDMWSDADLEYVNQPQEDRDRRAVNYLRHECTEYDDALLERARRVGIVEVHGRLKGRILRQIIGRFPELQAAAEAQM